MKNKKVSASKKKSRKLVVGVIQGAPLYYATPIRISNLTKRLKNVELIQIAPTWWPKSRFLKFFAVITQTLKSLNPWFKPDVIIASAPLIASSVPALVCKKIRKIPVIADWDDCFVDFRKHVPKIWEQEYAEYKIVQNADYIITVADETTNIASAWNKKVTYIPNGVDLQIFDPKKLEKERAKLRKKSFFSKQDIVLGFVGSLNIVNNNGYVGSEIVDILEKVPQTKALIVGFGPGLDLFKEDVKKRGLENRVFFSGFVAHDDVAKTLYASDIGIVPFGDTFTARARSSCKLKEFLALGMPVVTVKVGENIKDVTSSCGVLVQNNSKLTEGVREIIKNKKKYSFGRKQAKKYSFDVLSIHLQKIISQVIRK